MKARQATSSNVASLRALPWTWILFAAVSAAPAGAAENAKGQQTVKAAPEAAQPSAKAVEAKTSPSKVKGKIAEKGAQGSEVKCDLDNASKLRTPPRPRCDEDLVIPAQPQGIKY